MLISAGNFLRKTGLLKSSREEREKEMLVENVTQIHSKLF